MIKTEKKDKMRRNVHVYSSLHISIKFQVRYSTPWRCRALERPFELLSEIPVHGFHGGIFFKRVAAQFPP
jgi:hypothetical protein